MINRNGQAIYINYESGHWELDGRRVTMENGWFFMNSDLSLGNAVPSELVNDIRLVNAEFGIKSDAPPYTPFYTLAADLNAHPKGTQYYVPGLTDTNGTGIFEVQDLCNGCGARDFDTYVSGFSDYIGWINRDTENLATYVWTNKPRYGGAR